MKWAFNSVAVAILSPGGEAVNLSLLFLLFLLFLLLLSVIVAVNCGFSQDKEKSIQISKNKNNYKPTGQQIKSTKQSVKQNRSARFVARNSGNSSNRNSKQPSLSAQHVFSPVTKITSRKNQQQRVTYNNNRLQGSSSKVCLPKLQTKLHTCTIRQENKLSNSATPYYQSHELKSTKTNFSSLKSNQIKTHESQDSINSIVANRIEPRKTEELIDMDVISVIPNPDEDPMVL